MDCPRRLFALPALSALALALGCAGPPVSAPIDGIPVCPDFTTGNAKMEGGFRFPVRLRVLDGKNTLYRTIISGLRTADAPKPYSFITDDNARYTVEWAQCSNPRAPHPVAELAHGQKAREKARDGEGTAYDCGEATVYKADGVLETKKGDRASHVITFLPPPNAECWVGEVPPAPGPGAEPSDAGAALPGDAGIAVPTGDAGAAIPAGDAGAPYGDAGAAITSDAGALKAKP
jgi:hypothetical protein